MDSIAIRKRLDELIATRGEDYASLSRRLGRNPTYIQQFVKRGVPRRLSETDRAPARPAFRHRRTPARRPR